jgi:HD-GYP domain-containing protein (c-di-GMP phosphodiesterase class II)
MLLTSEHIERLERLGFKSLPINDSHTADLGPYVHDDELLETQEKTREEFENFVDDLDRKDDDTGSDKYKRLREVVSSMMDTLAGTQVMAAFTLLKQHDDLTSWYTHSVDVAKLSLQLAIENENFFRHKLNEESGASQSYINRHFLKDLGLGALLHDLGKKEVNMKILQKEGELTEEEWNEIRKHPAEGFRELRGLGFKINAPAKVPAYQHHERFDGSGYPEGLEGKDIHLFGRITCVADVYSALTTKRPYRRAKTPSQALSIMDDMQKEGPHFDPEIYERFLEIVFPYPVGQQVELSDGRSGVVCDVDSENPYEPDVRITPDDDPELDTSMEISLSDPSVELTISHPPGLSKSPV